MGLTDFLFPKKCVNCKRFGDFLCADCFSKIKYVEEFNHDSSGSLNGAVSVVIYNGVVRKLIRQFKYKPYISGLGETISEIMNEGLAQNESLYNFIKQFKPIVIPIPLSSNRFRERGYNHAEIIASQVAKYFHLKIEPRILVRIKDTKPQYKLNKEARVKNLAGAFGIRENQQIPKSVVIIDDLATSLATLKEAARVLKQKGSKRVLGVTFAREI